jgi:undecaprenyl diphosphate synthase
MQRDASGDGIHLGVIMDGNGRWATARGLPRHRGHRAGVEAIRRIVEAAPDLGVGVLTLYAFSSDNWRRPAEEVALLMRLVRAYLRAETNRLVRSGVRLSVIGRRDRLPASIVAAIGKAEAATAGGRDLHLRIALDYSARDAIVSAVARIVTSGFDPGSLDRASVAHMITGDPGLRDVDLIIRTSGEQRLSDFLLWESAYAELYFTPVPWPEFSVADLTAALKAFSTRERRFGGLGPSSLPVAA